MNYKSTKHIECPINDSTTIKFETDAEDNYFNEHTGIGKIDYNHDIIDHQTLKTGIFSLKLRPSIAFSNLEVGQYINFRFSIMEKSKNIFNFEIPIKITSAIEKKPPDSPGPHKPRKPIMPYTRTVVSDDEPDDEGRWTPPEIKTISNEGSQEKKWNEMFNGNIRRGVSVDMKSDGSMTIWVNISHPSLVKYQEKHPDLTKSKLVAKYANYIGLTTYATYCIKEGKIIEYTKESDVKEMMEATSDAIALFGMLYSDAT